jgi:hypothetical protein
MNIFLPILFMIIIIIYFMFIDYKKERERKNNLKIYYNVQVRQKENSSTKKYFSIEVINKEYVDKPNNFEGLQAYTLVIIQDNWFDSINDAIKYFNVTKENFLKKGFIEKKQLGDYFI